MNGNRKSMPRPRVQLTEVGPRDGFQFEKKPVPTALKIEIITALIDAGLRCIQVASFVHPKKVPQMADAEDLLQGLPRISGVRYSALVLNRRGLDRALGCRVDDVEVSVSASEAHGRKNAGMGMAEAASQASTMIREAKAAGLRARAGIQNAFGCVYEGRIDEDRVLALADGFLEAGADVLSLADTTGLGGPDQVRRLLDLLLPRTGQVPLALHLHDTRGLGLVNAAAAFRLGVARFDTAVGGLGGCPFVPGAAGNIATEDSAYLFSRLGAETGVDIGRLADITERLEAFFGKRFPVRNRKTTIAGYAGS